MQARLDKWKQNQLPVKSAEKIRGPWPLKCRPVRRDHGDDVTDFQKKYEEALEKHSNPQEKK
jgi:hypothetical protein